MLRVDCPLFDTIVPSNLRMHTENICYHPHTCSICLQLLNEPRDSREQKHRLTNTCKQKKILIQMTSNLITKMINKIKFNQHFLCPELVIKVCTLRKIVSPKAESWNHYDRFYDFPFRSQSQFLLFLLLSESLEVSQRRKEKKLWFLCVTSLTSDCEDGWKLDGQYELPACRRYRVDLCGGHRVGISFHLGVGFAMSSTTFYFTLNLPAAS